MIFFGGNDGVVKVDVELITRPQAPSRYCIFNQYIAIARLFEHTGLRRALGWATAVGYNQKNRNDKEREVLMSLGSWDPNAEQARSTLSLNRELLARYIQLSESQQLDNLATELSAEEQQVHAALMQLDKAQWMEQAATFSDEEIEHLMRFFTKAEQLPGWEAGPNSPVIWLGRVLKQRGTGISKELVLWIKANSDNRFLPHGPLL